MLNKINVLPYARVVLREKKRILNIFGVSETELTLLIELNYYHRITQGALRTGLGRHCYTFLTVKNGREKLVNMGLIEVFRLPGKIRNGQSAEVYHYMITGKGRTLLQEINNHLAAKMSELTFDKTRFEKNPKLGDNLRKKT